MAKKPPAYQMYARDWNSSPTIAQMNLHDRGVFITALNAAWDSEEPGTLPANLDIAAKICRIQPRTFRNFLIRFPSTFKVIGDKMVSPKLSEIWANYQQISEIRRKAAESRHQKQDAIAEQEHQPASALASASALAPETKPKPMRKTRALPPSAEFDIFWVLYPKKKGKQDARIAWEKNVNGHASIVIEGLSDYCQQSRGKYRIFNTYRCRPLS